MKKKKKNIGLIVMGCGGVGRQLLHHITACRSLHSNQGICLRVLGVCDSKSLLLASDDSISELDDNILLEICRLKSNGSSLQACRAFGDCKVISYPESMTKLIDIAAFLGRSTGLAFIDCSASSETIEVISQVVNLGCCAVLANKKPLTCSMEEFDKLFSQPRRIRHESTVGAGLPVIASLNRMLSSGDLINCIIGSLSGTLGYVMSQVEDGKLFSQVVKDAKSLGYTEPDPRDDLSGMDVGRKGLILARLLGLRINLDSIKIESMYPENMGPNMMSVEDFLVKGLPSLDRDIEEKVRKASLNGNVLRYVCVIEHSRCEVGIQEVPKESALGRLKGSDNVLEIYSRCYIASNLWLFKVLVQGTIRLQLVFLLISLIFKIYFLEAKRSTFLIVPSHYCGELIQNDPFQFIGAGDG